MSKSAIHAHKRRHKDAGVDDAPFTSSVLVQVIFESGGGIASKNNQPVIFMCATLRLIPARCNLFLLLLLKTMEPLRPSWTHSSRWTRSTWQLPASASLVFSPLRSLVTLLLGPSVFSGTRTGLASLSLPLAVSLESPATGMAVTQTLLAGFSLLQRRQRSSGWKI